MAGPRLATLTRRPVIPDQVTGLRPVARAEPGARCTARPRHRAGDRRLAVPLPARPPRAAALRCGAARPASSCVSAVVVLLARCGASAGRWSWQFFLLGAGFMLLETKSIIQFALLWGSTWVVASLAIAVGADDGAGGELRRVADGDHGGRGSSCGGARGAAGAQLRHPGRHASGSRAAPSSRSSTPC